jgi:hypothetical protein
MGFYILLLGYSFFCGIHVSVLNIGAAKTKWEIKLRLNHDSTH